MKKIIALLSLTTFLVGCGTGTPIVNKETKKDFFIQTTPLQDLGTSSQIEKSGKLESKNEIKLSSQANGRVESILVKNGDKVKAGQTLVILKDTTANYKENLAKSYNTLEKMRINYDSTKISLDKQVFDAQITLEKLQKNLETLKTGASIDISQAKENLENTSYTAMDSKSALELQKINDAITKTETDYQNTLTNNNETITGFKNTTKKEYTNITNLTDDISNFGDKLFDITGLYKNDVEIFEIFLGGKDLKQKEATKTALLSMIEYKKKNLNTLNFENISDDQLLQYNTQIEKLYSLMDDFLGKLKQTLYNSIVSVGQLSQTQIDAYSTTVSSYQSQMNGYNASFTPSKNSITSFLKSYKNNQASLLQQLNIQKKDKDIYLKNYNLSASSSQNTLTKVITSSSDNIRSLELQVIQASQTLESTKKTRDITLKSMQNAINDAGISSQLSQKDVEKLTIKASIDGSVGNIFIDQGQDVNIGTAILTLSGNNTSQVELSFEASELTYVSVGDIISTSIGDKTLTGSIYSISNVSDDSINYKVLGVFHETIENIGGVIKVMIPIKTQKILLPLQSIEMIGTNKGIIRLLENQKIVEKEVLLGKLYTNNVEFLGFSDNTALSSNMTLIISDVSNFDETKFTLKIKN